ncbi:hypothetical protein ACFXPV_31370 [Streptomyces sp. NPDC059118]|uniref:hypothetical protein n=1 Tax=unclassified Streptomyces TaxID=2593676 RepID=UPI0036C9E3F4
MSYLGRAAGVTKLKVGDFMEGLKASQAAIDDMARNAPTGAPPHTGGVDAPPGHEYIDHAGNKRIIGDDAYIRDEHGNVVPDTQPVREPHKDDLPNTHETTPAEEKVLEGAGGPSHAESAAGHPTGSAHPGNAAHPTGSGATHEAPSVASANHLPGSTAPHSPGSAADNTVRNSHTTPGGNSSEPPGGTGTSATGGGTATHSEPSATGGDGHGDGSGIPHQEGSGSHGASGGSDAGSHGDAPDSLQSGAEHQPMNPKAVDERITELDDRKGGQGHAPGRHLYPNEQVLTDRLGTVLRDNNGAPKLYGPNSNYPGLVKSENNVDPLTGTTVDGVTGGTHRVGAFATRFDNAEDMVRADAYFREEMARTGSEPMETPISDVLGPDAERRFTGYYRDPANLKEFKPVNFEGGTIVPVYRLLPDGQYRLHTMFANPARGRHP